jgi:hypothetical protein
MVVTISTVIYEASVYKFLVRKGQWKVKYLLDVQKTILFWSTCVFFYATIFIIISFYKTQDEFSAAMLNLQVRITINTIMSILMIYINVI